MDRDLHSPHPCGLCRR